MALVACSLQQSRKNVNKPQTKYLALARIIMIICATRTRSLLQDSGNLGEEKDKPKDWFIKKRSKLRMSFCAILITGWHEMTKRIE